MSDPLAHVHTTLRSRKQPAQLSQLALLLLHPPPLGIQHPACPDPGYNELGHEKHLIPDTPRRVFTIQARSGPRPPRHTLSSSEIAHWVTTPCSSSRLRHKPVNLAISRRRSHACTLRCAHASKACTSSEMGFHGPAMTLRCLVESVAHVR